MSCSVRLINEATSNATLFAAGVAVSSAASAGVADYAPFTCNNTLTVVRGSGAPVPVRGVPSSIATVLVLDDAKAGVAAVLYSDTAEAYPDAEDGSTIDLAGVRFINARGGAVEVAAVPDECYHCELPAQFGGPLKRGAAALLNVSTKYGLDISLDGARATSLPHLAEHGLFTLVLGADGGTKLLTDAPGRDANLPLLWLALVIVAAFVAHRLATWAVAMRAAAAVRAGTAAEDAGVPPPERRAVTPTSFFALDTAAAAAAAKALADRASATDEYDAAATADAASASLLGSLQQEGGRADGGGGAPLRQGAVTKKKTERVLGIDTFRGISLCIMIFVNASGGRYAFLNHSRWNGLTVADLVFPWFVFTSGVSYALSSSVERRRGATPWALLVRAIVRSLKLIAIGILLINDPPFLGRARIPSVLGYFAFSGLTISVVDAFVPIIGGRGGVEPPHTIAQALWLDCGRYGLQWAAMAVVWAVYLGLQFLLPVPGCPTGYLGAGGLADGGAYAACTGGAHAFIDKQFFGLAHIDNSPTCSGSDGIYRCGPHDPEGLLGGLSAAWMAWLGLVAGRVLVLQRELATRSSSGGSARAIAQPLAARWLVSAVVLCAIAGALCGFAKEGGWMPVNKNLWSPSFVLLLAGWANLLLAGTFALVDAAQAWDGAPFRFVGANSLAIYLTSELLAKHVPFVTYFNASGDWASHSEALASNCLFVVALLVLARFWNLHGWSYNV